MKSALRERLALLGEAALPELTEYALTRLSDLRTARDAQFQEKLDRFARIAASDFQHRQRGSRALPEQRTVFDRSNVSVQIVRSIQRFLLARVFKGLFGSRPWLAATPEGPHDEALADEIQKHADWKLRACGWQEKGREALATTLALGFAPVKTTWREDWDASERIGSILFDPEENRPVVTAAGEFVYQEQGALAESSGPGAGPEAAEAEAGPEGPFKEYLIEEKTRLYAGLDFSPLNWKDVAWPVNAASLDLGGDCDFIAVTRDMTLEQIRASYDPDGTDAEVQALLETLQSDPLLPQSEGALPKPEQEETEVRGSDPKNPTIKITECYFRRRILSAGPESRIFLVLAETHRQAVWLEYLAKISPRAQAPVHLVSINTVPGRAYGRGLFEIYEMAAEAIDRLINSVIVRNEYHANALKLIDKKAFEGVENGEPIAVGPDLWLPVDLKGLSANEICKVLELPDLDQRSWQLLELFMQLIQVESGVTNASQGDLSSLPGNGTATGVTSLLESSSVLHEYVLEEVRSGLTPALRYAVELIYFCQDSDETYDYLQGDDGAIERLVAAEREVAAAAPAEGGALPARTPSSGTMTLAQAQALANLPMNVQILLSCARREEMKEAAFTAIPYVQQFYAMPPALQLRLLPLYVQAVRGLDIPNADLLFPAPRDLQHAMRAPATPAAAAPPVAPMEHAPLQAKTEPEGA